MSLNLNHEIETETCADTTTTQTAIERVILDPKYHDVLAVLKGARNGAVYGTKVRFPHALVMICLFRSGT